MKFAFPLAVACLLLFLPVISLQAQWVRQYPLSKMEDVIAIDVSQDGHGFAAGPNDMILRLNPTSQTWDLLPGYGEGWRFEAVDYLDGSNGNIAAVGGQRLIITTNNGQTWTEIPDAPLGIHTLKLFSATHLIAMGDDGVFRWQNDTWTDLADPASVALKGGYILDDQRMWAFSFATNPAIYYTTNGGQSWSTNTDIDDIDVVVFFDAMNGTATDGRMIYKTVNGGANWTLLSNNEIHNSANDLTYGSSINVLMAATPNGDPAITTDGGLTWEQLSTDLVNQRNYSIIAISDTEFWMGNDISGIAYTDDQGQTWEERSGPERNLIQDVFFINRNIGLATGQEGYLLRTVDGGTNWKDISFGTRTYHSVFGLAVNDIWLGANQRIFHSIDTGSTWVEKGVFAGGNITDILALSGERIIASVSTGNILISRDGGDSWDTVYTNLNPVRSLAKVDNNRIIATGFNGLLLRSDNQGDTWTTLTPPEAGLQYEQAFFLNGEGWLVTSSFKKTMWHTENNGDSWTPITLPIDRFWDGVYFITPDTGIVVGRSSTEGRAYITYTGGQSWTAAYTTSFPLYGVAGLPNPNGTAWIYGYGSDIEVLPYCNTLPSIADFQGDLFPCQADTIVYSLRSENVEQFNWLLPPGWQILGDANNDTISVVVGNTSGFISVSGTNLCGSSGQLSFSAGADLLPVINSLQGATLGCTGEIELYDASGLHIDNYSWSVPGDWQIQGSTDQSFIEVIVGTVQGPLSVSGINECGQDTEEIIVFASPVPFLELDNYDATPCPGDTTYIEITTEPLTTVTLFIAEGLEDWQALSVTPGGIYMMVGFDSGTLGILSDNQSCFSAPLLLPFSPEVVPEVSIAFNEPQIILGVSDISFDYSWYLNGELISGANEATYTPAVSGNYHAVVIFPSGCSYITDVINVMVTATEDIASLPLMIYPVPAGEKIFIPGLPQSSSFSMYDIHGKKVMEGVIKENQADITSLLPGLYYLRVQTEAALYTGKVVKE